MVYPAILLTDVWCSDTRGGSLWLPGWVFRGKS
jgi:hypothetical protein